MFSITTVSLIIALASGAPVEKVVPHQKFINGTCFSVAENGVCINNSSLNVTNTHISNTTFQNTTCEFCIGIVSIIKAELNMVNGSISNITHFIDAICSHISGPSAKECLLVSRSIQKIVSDIDHGLNVTETCHSIGMC